VLGISSAAASSKSNSSSRSLSGSAEQTAPIVVMEAAFSAQEATLRGLCFFVIVLCSYLASSGGVQHPSSPEACAGGQRIRCFAASLLRASCATLINNGCRQALVPTGLRAAGRVLLTVWYALAGLLCWFSIASLSPLLLFAAPRREQRVDYRGRPRDLGRGSKTGLSSPHISTEGSGRRSQASTRETGRLCDSIRG
jgi:hypothetical protein